MPYKDLEEIEKQFPKQELNHHIRNYITSTMGLLKRLEKHVSDSTHLDEILEKSLRDLKKIKHRTKGIIIGLNYEKKYRNIKDMEKGSTDG
jgi:hypothetical protein